MSVKFINTSSSSNSAFRVVSGEILIEREWTSYAEVVLGYVFEGSMVLQTTTNSYNLYKGDLYVLSPNQKHIINNTGNARVKVIMLNLGNPNGSTQEFVPQSVIRALTTGNCTHFALVEPSEQYYEQKLEAFNTIFEAEQERYDYFQLIVHGKLYELFYYFFSTGKIKVYNIESQGKKYRALRRVTEYVNDNFSDLITLESIAEETGLSRYYISHLFKELMNTTFINYLNELRLSRAAMLLTTTDTPIIEIAGLSGFNNISNFNRAFKMYYSTTPSRYRRLEKHAFNK